MKKTIVLALSSFLVLPSLASPQLAAAERSTAETIQTEKQDSHLMKEANITKEQAIKIAKQAFQIPSNYKQTQVQFQAHEFRQARTTWTIHWDKQEEKAHAFIRITVDAQNGNVLAIHSSQNQSEDQASYPPELNRTEAKQVAEQYLEDTFPQKASQFIYDNAEDEHAKPPLQGNALYHFTFYQSVNGIPFQENYARISVNGDGEIINFNYQWLNDYSFPSKQDLLSKEAALARIKESLPLELQYQTIHGGAGILPRKENQEGQTKLVYAPDSNVRWFHAKSGEWITRSGKSFEPNSNNEATITESPAGEAPAEGKQLTSKQAEEHVKKLITLPTEAALMDVNYEESEHLNERAVWHLRWSDNNDNPALWINATVNAKTGELINFYQHSAKDNEKQANKISKEEAKSIAIKKLKQFIPYKTDKLALTHDERFYPSPSEQNHYRFRLERIHDGVPVVEQQTMITISAVNGELLEYHHNWEDTTFPSTDAAVSEEQAKDTFFELYNVKLQYVLTEHPYQENNETKQDVIPVYSLERIPTDEPIYLDAVEGAWISSDTGSPYQIEVNAEDIEGHWAEKELRLMVEYRALQPDTEGKIYPDKPITRGEMIKMLMLTQRPAHYYREMSTKYAEQSTFNDVSSGSPYHVYIEEAVRQGLIEGKAEDFHPNEKVSREELALLITKALGYDKLAQKDALFKLSFKDSEAINERGPVAIMQHLGIMNGVNGYFYPERKVTRAEAAKSYYQYLKERDNYTRNMW
ncbi:S-layer homology domain-containing protein [Bacillus tianshenii]|nr:S-layer homology domain-containing protein [Bacillus tianshenii]